MADIRSPEVSISRLIPVTKPEITPSGSLANARALSAVFGHSRQYGDQLAQFAQDRRLGAHAHIDSGHRHVRRGRDVGHGGPGIAALDEEGSCCVEDGLAGGRRLLLPALGVVLGP